MLFLCSDFKEGNDELFRMNLEGEHYYHCKSTNVSSILVGGRVVKILTGLTRHSGFQVKGVSHF